MNRTTSALLADYVLATKVAGGVGSLAQRLVYSDEELLISLANSLKLRKQEIAELGSFTSRLMALFVGKDAGNDISIDGMRLKQLQDLAGSKPAAGIDLNGIYDVNLAYFRALLKKAEKAAKAKARDIASAPVPQ
jgi:hypothetical protein